LQQLKGQLLAWGNVGLEEGRSDSAVGNWEAGECGCGRCGWRVARKKSRIVRAGCFIPVVQ